MGELGKQLPTDLALSPGTIPEPYGRQVKQYDQSPLGIGMSRQSMRDASHASSNDGVTPRVYGFSLMDVMLQRSFAAGVVLYWTGELPRDEFEEKLADMTLIAALTNGPGTISAQGAKLSASAGNRPNTAMVATLASIGTVHGGNGAKAVEFLLDVFAKENIEDPYQTKVDVAAIGKRVADEYKKKKIAAKDADIEYGKIPCLGHPVFRNDPVNFDPREQVIYQYIQSQGRSNVFLEFYHHLAHALKDNSRGNRVY